MRKSLLVLGLLAVALPQLFAEPETAAILSAADTYLRANATVTTELKYIGRTDRGRPGPGADQSSGKA